MAGLLAAVPLALASGCVGDIGDGGSSDVEIPSAKDANEVGVSGARRLTAREYHDAVLDLTGVDLPDAELILPVDERTPFDNDFTKQIASQALVDGADLLAGEAAQAALADPALRQKIVPCTPAGPTDEACFRTFVTSFGRRALRRPLTAAEEDAFVAHFLPHAEHEQDFWVAVDSGLRAFLQHADFLYRVEIGEPVPGMAGLFRLGDFEIASRLSFFLVGSGPPEWLLDSAEAGELTDPENLRASAELLLDDPRAIERLSRFHAMWLSYELIPQSPEMLAAMKQETDALLSRVILEDRTPWTDVLVSDETFVTAELATHYGLAAPADPAGAWVGYGDSGRRGLLSHGTFLGAVAKFSDTSPTQRGLLIRTRLFCQTIERPPPDLGVNVDMPPQAADPNACKPDRYTMWKTDGCSSCHALMDPVGFGLENFDSAGRFRTSEPDKPECAIDGQGNLEGIGAFSGPAELGQLMIDSGEVDACVARQLYRYTVGRFDLDAHDEALLSRVVEQTQAGGEALRIDALIGELVASEAFQLRREEVSQ